jgi:hypothetical protein
MRREQHLLNYQHVLVGCQASNPGRRGATGGCMKMLRAQDASSAHARPHGANGGNMKKKSDDADEMRAEYDFSGGVRGKYAERYARQLVHPRRACRRSGADHDAAVRRRTERQEDGRRAGGFRRDGGGLESKGGLTRAARRWLGCPLSPDPLASHLRLARLPAIGWTRRMHRQPPARVIAPKIAQADRSRRGCHQAPLHAAAARHAGTLLMTAHTVTWLRSITRPASSRRQTARAQNDP